MKGTLIDSQVVRVMRTAPFWTAEEVRAELPSGRYTSQKVRGSLIRLERKGMVEVCRPDGRE